MRDVIELTDGSRWRPLPGGRNDGSWDHEPADAEKIAAALQSLIGKRVLLYGGGGSNVWLVTLRGVGLEPSGWKKLEGRIAVRVQLYGNNLPFGKKSFDPLLSSWWIAVRETCGILMRTRRGAAVRDRKCVRAWGHLGAHRYGVSSVGGKP